MSRIKLTGVTLEGNGGHGLTIGSYGVQCPKCGSTDVAISGLVVNDGNVNNAGVVTCLKCGYVGPPPSIPTP